MGKKSGTYGSGGAGLMQPKPPASSQPTKVPATMAQAVNAVKSNMQPSAKTRSPAQQAQASAWAAKGRANRPKKGG